MIRKALRYHYICWFLLGTLGIAQSSDVATTSSNTILHILEQNKTTNVLDKGSLEKKLVRYYQGLSLLDQVSDSLKIAFYENYTGILARNNLFKESNKNAIKAIPLYEKSQIKNLDLEKSFYSNLASNYIQLQKYDSVTWAYKKVIDLDSRYPKEISPLVSMNNLGYHYYKNLKKYDSALFYFSKKAQYENVLHLHGNFKWSLNDNIALVYRELGQLSEAKDLFIENYEFYVQDHSRRGTQERWIRAGLQWADIEIRQGHLKEAYLLLQKIQLDVDTLPKYSNSSTSTLLLLQTKSAYAKAVNDYQQAYQLREQYYKLKDSLSIQKEKEQQKDVTLLRDIGLQNAKSTLKQEQIINAIEKKSLKLNLQRKSAKVYGLLATGILVSILISGYIYYRRTQQFALQRQQLQANYAQDLIKNQEEERIRVAREIHDSVGQKLILLSKKATDTGDTAAQVLVGDTLEELRSISRSLHPVILKNLGLTKAIESLINEIDASTPIFFTHQIDPIDHILPKETTLQVYRIVQETLNNIVKHADAKAASVIIEHKEHTIEATISDNGKGFDVTQQLNNETCLGMKTLLERAKIIQSKLNISSTPDQGTKVQLSLPL